MSMDLSDWLSVGALVISLCALGFSWYTFEIGRVAKLDFRMSIERSYSSAPSPDASGQTRRTITAEHEPKTRLLVRNLSSRPSAITEIRAQNPEGAILMDFEKKPPGGHMPIKIDPWAVEIIETTWPAGEHTEGLFFEVTDIDDWVYTVYDYTDNRRLTVGEDFLAQTGPGTLRRWQDGSWV